MTELLPEEQFRAIEKLIHDNPETVAANKIHNLFKEQKTAFAKEQVELALKKITIAEGIPMSVLLKDLEKEY